MFTYNGIAFSLKKKGTSVVFHLQFKDNKYANMQNSFKSLSTVWLTYL